MIGTVTTDAQRMQVMQALRQADPSPVVCELASRFVVFGSLPGSPWQFYTGAPGQRPLALGVRGKSALLAGWAQPEELASCLEFLGVDQLRTAGTVPKGWQCAKPLVAMKLHTPRPQPMPKEIQLEQQPSLWQVAQLMAASDSFAGQSQQVLDELYSEMCTLCNHGAGRIWAVRQADQLAAVAGAWGLWEGRAYLSGVETIPHRRHQGLASWLTVQLAAHLQGEGFQVELLCSPALQPFYTRLGFAPAGEGGIYRPPTTTISTKG